MRTLFLVATSVLVFSLAALAQDPTPEATKKFLEERERRIRSVASPEYIKRMDEEAARQKQWAIDHPPSPQPKVVQLTSGAYACDTEQAKSDANRLLKKISRVSIIQVYNFRTNPQFAQLLSDPPSEEEQTRLNQLTATE